MPSKVEVGLGAGLLILGGWLLQSIRELLLKAPIAGAFGVVALGVFAFGATLVGGAWMIARAYE
jgi:hypothetical protein